MLAIKVGTDGNKRVFVFALHSFIDMPAGVVVFL